MPVQFGGATVAGAAIGTAIGGPVGTVVGGGLGLGVDVIGVVVGFAAFNAWKSSRTKPDKDKQHNS